MTGYYGGNCVVTPTDPARVFNTGTVFYTQPTDNSEQHLDMVNHGDELTIAYLDGVHTGKKMAAQPAAAIPEGYKLVPITPTERMVEAGLKAFEKRATSPTRAAWKAMLSAAPTQGEAK